MTVTTSISALRIGIHICLPVQMSSIFDCIVTLALDLLLQYMLAANGDLASGNSAFLVFPSLPGDNLLILYGILLCNILFLPFFWLLVPLRVHVLQ